VVIDMKNSFRVIFPYKRYGVWAFDDPSVGLLQEPFVLGVPEIIEARVKDIPDGFALFFSASPFPRHSVELVWLREDGGGNWYREIRHGPGGMALPRSVLLLRKSAQATIFCRRAQIESQNPVVD
jgi:hypothetical protein